MLDDLRSTQDFGLFDKDHFVDDVQSYLESGSDGFAAIDGRRSMLVASFDFGQHLVNVGGGECVLRSLADGLQFGFGFDHRAAGTGCWSTRRIHSPTVRCSRFARLWMADISSSGRSA
jgi:hypothetical protein